MSRKLKILKLGNMILTIIMVLDILAVVGLGIQRSQANLWPKEEVWVNQYNKNSVEAYVSSLNLPKDNVERVVYIPGLGDCRVEVYYKDKTVEYTGCLEEAYSDIFTQYGETEGSRKAICILAVLLVIFALDFIGKQMIGLKMEHI